MITRRVQRRRRPLGDARSAPRRRSSPGAPRPRARPTWITRSRLLARKAESGARFVLTQPFYSIEPLVAIRETYEKVAVGPLTGPILAGVLPLMTSARRVPPQRGARDRDPRGRPGSDALGAATTTSGRGEEGATMAVELISALREEGVAGRLRDAAVRPVRPSRRGGRGGSRTGYDVTFRPFQTDPIHRFEAPIHAVSETAEQTQRTAPPSSTRCSLASGRGPPEERDALEAFAKAFLRRLSDEELEHHGIGPVVLDGVLGVRLRRSARERAVGGPRVRADATPMRGTGRSARSWRRTRTTRPSWSTR
jgi:hypothetical protein